MVVLLPIINIIITYHDLSYYVAITYYYSTIITYHYRNNGFMITY